VVNANRGPLLPHKPSEGSAKNKQASCSISFLWARRKKARKKEKQKIDGDRNLS
jgi:hypothetical protein